MHLKSTMKGVVQLVSPRVCYLKVISSIPQTSRLLEVYKVVNFRACKIIRGTHKLAQIPVLIKKNTFNTSIEKHEKKRKKETVIYLYFQ